MNFSKINITSWTSIKLCNLFCFLKFDQVLLASSGNEKYCKASCKILRPNWTIEELLWFWNFGILEFLKFLEFCWFHSWFTVHPFSCVVVESHFYNLWCFVLVIGASILLYLEPLNTRAEEWEEEKLTLFHMLSWCYTN